jgi:hypothetical protein
MTYQAVADVLSWLGINAIHQKDLGPHVKYTENGRGFYDSPPTTLPVQRGFDYTTVKDWCCMMETVPGCNLVSCSTWCFASTMFQATEVTAARLTRSVRVAAVPHNCRQQVSAAVKLSRRQS